MIPIAPITVTQTIEQTLEATDIRPEYIVIDMRDPAKIRINADVRPYAIANGPPVYAKDPIQRSTTDAVEAAGNLKSLAAFFVAIEAVGSEWATYDQARKSDWDAAIEAENVAGQALSDAQTALQVARATAQPAGAALMQAQVARAQAKDADAITAADAAIVTAQAAYDTAQIRVTAAQQVVGAAQAAVDRAGANEAIARAAYDDPCNPRLVTA